MWQLYFDREVDKWLVAEYSREIDDKLFFHFRIQAALSCARKNGIASSAPFWAEGEGDEYE